MNMALFLASVKDKRILFKNDAVFRQFIAEFEGQQVEIIVRKADADKYSFLDSTSKRIIQDFMNEFSVGEAACAIAWSGAGYDSWDTILMLAKRRLSRGETVPDGIIRLFSLDTRQPMLFADEPSNKSISKAVSE